MGAHVLDWHSIRGLMVEGGRRGRGNDELSCFSDPLEWYKLTFCKSSGMKVEKAKQAYYNACHVFGVSYSSKSICEKRNKNSILIKIQFRLKRSTTALQYGD